MQYRREIDGLRSVAVLPVVLFHAGFRSFSGGFVGVDIFFVISGYLITSILIAEQEQGRFSILGFYERRARRILPVLFFMILACLPFAWAWMLPAQMESFSKSIVAVCLFLSNVLFWQETGYFAAAAEQQPLLHTWSLAVEEQYYLLFPLMIAALWRFGRRTVITSIAVVTLISLALAQYSSVDFPIANFYLPHTRAWELMTGSLCAFALSGGRHLKSNAMSLVGLALVIFSIFAYDESTPFPSLYALIPIGGAALIILFATGDTLTGRLLSTPPLVGIGLISYSIYLWHQPLFAFARIRSLTEPSLLLMSGLGALSIILAYFSWRFVEKPFRKGKAGIVTSQAQVFSASVAAAVLLIGIGVYGQSDGGLAFRMPPQAMDALAVQENPDPALENCLFDKGQSSLPHPVKACLTAGSQGSDTILIGDSHAGAIAGEALRQFAAKGLDLYAMAHSACVGFSGFYVYNPKYALRCNSFFTGIEDYIRKSNIKTVIMLSRWSLYIDGHPFDNGEGGLESTSPIYIDLMDRRGENATIDDPERKARVLKQYILDIQAYLDRGINVVLVYPIPEAGWNVPDYVAKSAIAGAKSLEVSTSYERYLTRNQAVIDAFDALSHPRLFKVKPASAFCNSFVKDRCINGLNDNRVFYFDDDHPSDAGADLILPDILKAVETIKAKAS